MHCVCSCVRGGRIPTPVEFHNMSIRAVEKARARIDAFQQRFIEEICSQPYSFFVVTDVDPGKGMSIKDLFLGREVYVHERQASSRLRRGSIIYSRIIDMDGDAILVGCAPTVVPPAFLHDFVDMREDFEKNVQALERDLLLQYDVELRTIYYDIR